MYQDLTEVELAQRRMEKRRSKIIQIIFSIIGIIAFIVLQVIGSESLNCLWLLIAILVIYIVIRSIDLYYELPRNIPKQENTEQVMEWLFGKEWRETTGIKEYVLAQDRLIKLSKRRWRFALHLLIFIPSSLFTLASVFVGSLPTSNSLFIIGLLVLWLFIVISHGQDVFPSQHALEKQEKRFGERLRNELENMQTTQIEVRDKAKRDKYYAIGDDGELVEVEDDALLDDDKPKREHGG